MAENNYNQKGLSKKEVQERISSGLINKISKPKARSRLMILWTNFATLPSIMVYTAVGVLVAAGRFDDAFAISIIMTINLIIGSFQEFRSRAALEKIKFL
ncbi:MAG TPA: cation-transporting P-type ATPase, partial [Candidatus Dojkabacteria bacterium]